MRKLGYDDLPEEIRKVRQAAEIHKIHKPTKTTIVIYNKKGVKETWEKTGSFFQLASTGSAGVLP
jgi:hypothetical protein